MSYLSSDVGVHAHYADLVVVVRPDPEGRTAGPPGLVESLVLTSGRAKWVFGSVTRTVLHEAGLPVLMSR